jgi:anti-sigma factor RsiW
MDIPREVILDLVPLYLAGEASPATRAMVEDFLKEDPELDKRVRSEWAVGIGRAVPSALPPEIELKSLRRTRAVLALQRWLFGLGIFFVMAAFSVTLTFDGTRLIRARMVMGDYPGVCALSFAVGVVLFTVYYTLRRRMQNDGALNRSRRSSL